MKIICNQKLLANKIGISQKAINGKTTLELLKGILLSAKDGQLKLTGYDLEIGIETYTQAEVIEEGEIVGYAYASAFRPRAAYLHSIETSIYMRMDYRGKGVGRRLYETLAKLLVLQNVFNMEACIAHCDPADEYVPATSRLFMNA